jgi:hypothetical protein
MGFVLQLRIFGLDALELDGNLLARDDVRANVDVSKGARTDLVANEVLFSNAKNLRGGNVSYGSIVVREDTIVKKTKKDRAKRCTVVAMFVVGERGNDK